MSKVAILKVRDRGKLKDCVAKLVQCIGGMGRFVRPSSTVLIKPNVLCGLAAETGATVCPEVIEAIVEMCKDSGAKSIIIGEASNWGVDTLRAFRICGYNAIAERYGVSLVDLKKDRQIEVPCDDPMHHSIELPRTIFDVDIVINVPVLKTHNQAVVSFSLKNLSVGTCSDNMKKSRMHSIGLASALPEERRKKGSELDSMIAYVSKAIPCHLIVVDGFYGMQGHGAPVNGRPANAGMLLCGTNRVAVDGTCARLIGINPPEVPHLALASDIGIGTFRDEDIELVGDPLEDVRMQFESSIITDLESLAPANVKIVRGDGCYSCVSNLGYFLEQHRKKIEDLGPITFVIGKASSSSFSSESGRIVYYGNCAGQDMYGGGFVPGCVPRSRRQVFEALGIGDRYESYDMK